MQIGKVGLQGRPKLPQLQTPLAHLSTLSPVHAVSVAEHLQVPFPSFPLASQYGAVLFPVQTISPHLQIPLTQVSESLHFAFPFWHGSSLCKSIEFELLILYLDYLELTKLIFV